MNILLAEDNPVNQDVAVGFLELLDCTVTVVENGQQAVDAAGSEAFDLVLMDCQMPVMDGLEATRAIRSQAKDDKRLPIIALTANDDEETKADCLAAGMDDFLSKPFSRDQLGSLLQRWPQTGCASPPGETAIAAEPLASTLDMAPIETLRSLDPNGERQLLKRAIIKFVDYSDELVACLANAVDKRDVKETSRLVHSLKSSSANLGAIDLAGQCFEIERLAASGDLPDDINQRITTLKATQQTAKWDLLKLIET